MRPVMVALALWSTASAEEPPARLRCLQRYYRVAPERVDDGWVGQLPDGQRLPFAAPPRDFAARIERPTLEDMLLLPYRPGAIAPVDVVDEDPGRIRVEPLFAATYPRADLTRAPFLDRAVQIHRRVAPALKRVGDRLRALLAADRKRSDFLHPLGGTFVERQIAGTDRRSAHAYGIALDLNPSRGDYWRWAPRRSVGRKAQRGSWPPGPLKWRNRVPQAIVDAFEAEGFIWGGRWYHYDTMHFEYRPELFDPDCR
jgi:hypothetical protein